MKHLRSNIAVLLCAGLAAWGLTAVLDYYFLSPGIGFARCLFAPPVSHGLWDRVFFAAAAVFSAVFVMKVRGRWVIDEWRKAFDAVPDLVALLDTDHRIVRINKAMAKRLGDGAMSAEGRPCSEIVHGLAHPPDLGPLALLTKDGREHSAEIHEPRLGGYFQATVSPIFGASGTLIGSVLVAHDLAVRKRMEEQLLYAQKMEAVGLLAGGVAHHFNNILTGITGYTHLAKGIVPAGSELAGDIASIERLTRRAADLTDALLAFAKRGERLSEPIDIALTVNEMLPLLAQGVGKGIAVRTSLPAGLPFALGERAQVNQALMNLCINACEAMDGAGTLSIALSRVSPAEELYAAHPALRRGDYVAVSIADTGRGIDAESRKHIFEPFFTVRDDKTGVGLGLPVSMGIVERHGGCIEVSSTPGRGSIFTVYLPAAAGPPRMPPGEPEAR